MRVLFIVDYSFPSPTAPSNRLSSLVKAISLKGDEVDILCINGTYSTDADIIDTKNIKAKITFSTSKIRSRNFLIRNLSKIKGLLKSIIWIVSENRHKKIDHIFLPVKNALPNTCYLLLCRLTGIKILQERSEFPGIYKTSFFSKLGYYYYMKLLLKNYDGLIAMTDTLRDYYKKNMKKNAVVVTVPMSVDIDRFENERKIYQKKGDYIAYCGNLSNKKDGVDILIEAFAMISEKYRDLSLYLIGDSIDKDLIGNLKILCRDLKISDRVVFTGKVSLDEMPIYLNNATALALARPSSRQAQGGFPTKLGEYLATKNPVIVTDVGEIKKYLTDGVSAFISKPDSAEEFAKKIDDCLSDPQKASRIGINGYAVALKNFYYASQSDKISDFLENVRK
jgi:glycosyltransferase involved in cell wall biosynthesis